MRHETIIKRDNGAVIRLVAEGIMNVFTGKPDIDCYALVCMAPGDKEELFTYDRTQDKSLGGLSVDEYIKSGRKGLLAVVRPHEILKATTELEKMLLEGMPIMSVSHKELLQLIGDARARGAVITVTNNNERALQEGRDIIDSVQISGLSGIGSHPMGALSAAERLRDELHEMPALKIVVLGESWDEAALAAGETDQHWTEAEDDSASEQDLAGLLRKYGVHEPCVSGNGGTGWTVSTKERDAESFEQGLTKNFTLFVYEIDGSKLTDVNRRRVQAVFNGVNPSPKKSAPVSDGLSL